MSSGIQNRTETMRRALSLASCTASNALSKYFHECSLKVQAPPFFFKKEIEIGLKLMMYKCHEKVFRHFINVKLLLY